MYSPNKPQYNLAVAEIALDKYIASTSFRDLNDADKNFVLSLKNKIATLMAQRGWLKTAIIYASKTYTLATVIDQWLESKPDKGNKSYKQIIETRETKIAIRDLRNQMEINPHRLDLLRHLLLERIKDSLFNYDWSIAVSGSGGIQENKQLMPHTIFNLRTTLSQGLIQGKSVREILLAIKSVAEKSEGGFFYRLRQWRSSVLNDFYGCLSAIDPDSPGSLFLSRTNVISIVTNKLKLAAKPKQLPAQSPIIPPRRQNAA